MTNIGSLLVDASVLMITGMGFVFIFLTILVYLVRLMSSLIPAEESLPASAPPHTPISSDISPQVIAAISAAVHRHRQSDVQPRQ